MKRLSLATIGSSCVLLALCSSDAANGTDEAINYSTPVIRRFPAPAGNDRGSYGSKASLTAGAATSSSDPTPTPTPTPTPAPTATVPVTSVSIVDFGADPTGAADSGPALDAALVAAKGSGVLVPPGTYRIASRRWLRGNTVLVGNDATLFFDFVGVGLTGAGIRFEAYGLTFDGNEKATMLLDLANANLLLDDVSMRNVLAGAGATDSAYAVYCGSCNTSEIRNSTFTNIHAVANGVLGDSAGAARAIGLSKPVAEIIIKDNSFADVHSVDGNGSATMEDGDAVHVAEGGSGGVTVAGNHFSNIGKRAIKFQCDGAIARDNVIVSSWPDGTDLFFAAISTYGNNTTIAGNTIGGTNVQFGIELTEGDGNVVDGNTIDDTGAFTTSGPRGQRSGIVAYGQTSLHVNQNQVSNYRNGVLVEGGANTVLSNNTLTGVLTGTYLDHSTADVTVTGNGIVGRANTPGTVGSFFAAGTSGVVSGNSYQDVYDGVYVVDDAAVVVATDNTFADIGRKSVYP